MALTFDIKIVESTTGFKAVKVGMTGDLDNNFLSQFQDVMEKLFDKGAKNFILDCENLDFVGSSGLAKILIYTDQCEESGGGMALINVQKKLLMVIETMGFQEIINIFADQVMGLFWLEGKDDELK